jgi:hypothetical protein
LALVNATSNNLFTCISGKLKIKIKRWDSMAVQHWHNRDSLGNFQSRGINCPCTHILMTPFSLLSFPLSSSQTGSSLKMQNFEGILNPCSLPICTATCMAKFIFAESPADFVWRSKRAETKSSPFSSSREDLVELFRSKYRKIRGDDDFAPRCTVKSGEPNGAPPPRSSLSPIGCLE